MFKTSEVPINVLEVQLWYYQNILDMVQKVIFSSENILVQSKSFDIHKIKLDLQNINW